MAAAERRMFDSEREINDYLDAHGMREVELRIFAKHYLEATGKFRPHAPGRRVAVQFELLTDQSPGTSLSTDLNPGGSRLATDEEAAIAPELRAWLRKSRIDPEQPLSDGELDQRLQDAGLQPEQRIALKHLLGGLWHGQARGTGAGRKLQARATKVPGSIRASFADWA